MAPRPRRPTRFLSTTALFALAAQGCGDDPSPAPAPPPTAAVAAPRLPSLDDPATRIRDMETVEDLTEAVANRLLGWGEALRRRDPAREAEMLADGFVGTDLAALGAGADEPRSLGIVRVDHDDAALAALPVVDRDGFLAGMRAFLAPFSAVDAVRVKTVAAEFADDAADDASTPADGDGASPASSWGALSLVVHAVGRGDGVARLGRVASFRVRVERDDGDWRLSGARLTGLTELRRARPLFTDVAGSAGLAFEGPAFGTPENDSFFWNGAASHDVDGDGRFDLFVAGSERNRLYRNRGDGTFEERAGSAGVATPAGGTGALFADVDNDGDPDLALGRVAFENEGAPVGGPTVLFVNQGDGTFTEEGAARGLTAKNAAFSLAAADVDQDGWVDLHVCGYNAEGFVTPDSWHAADNGTPNLLYRNDGDGTFTEVGAEAGVADLGWSYAAAFADVDEDGDPDLYVANDYGPNRLYLNRGDGTFEDRAAELGVLDVGNGMGAAFGDEDGDGDLDLYVSNMSSTAGKRILARLYDPAKPDDLTRTIYKLAAGNSLYRWDGERFALLPTDRGGIDASWAWSAQFLDVDLDGDEDLACTNGFLSFHTGYEFKDT